MKLRAPRFAFCPALPPDNPAGSALDVGTILRCTWRDDKRSEDRECLVLEDDGQVGRIRRGGCAMGVGNGGGAGRSDGEGEKCVADHVGLPLKQTLVLKGH